MTLQMNDKEIDKNDTNENLFDDLEYFEDQDCETERLVS